MSAADTIQAGATNYRSGSSSSSSEHMDGTSDASSDGSSSGISGDAPSSSSPSDSPENDQVYLNKQLIAHLLRAVCSEKTHTNNNVYDSNSSSYGNGANGPVLQRPQVSGNSGLRSRSPGEEAAEPHHQASASQQQSQAHPQNHHQQQQHQHEHQQSQSSGSSSSDFLAVTSTQSYSTSYISPFAQSPISEQSPWYRPAISMMVVKDPRTKELQRILLRLCGEFEQRLHDRFDDFGARLNTMPDTIHVSVLNELESLFYDDSIHWGRIIAVFVFCREVCEKCAAEGRPELEQAVQQWVAEFIDARLWDWMKENQGWLGLVKFYRETGGDKAPNGGGDGTTAWKPVASLLTISAVSIGIALAAAYFRR